MVRFQLDRASDDETGLYSLGRPQLGLMDLEVDVCGLKRSWLGRTNQVYSFDLFEMENPIGSQILRGVSPIGGRFRVERWSEPVATVSPVYAFTRGRGVQVLAENAVLKTYDFHSGR